MAVVMLAMAYLYNGLLEECVFTVTRLQARVPQTAEDYLFMGQALINVDPKMAAKNIERALEKRNSPLARMILAQALAADAFDTGNSDLIARALREAQAARSFIGDTPLMLTTHLFVHHVAIKIVSDGASSHQPATIPSCTVLPWISTTTTSRSSEMTMLSFFFRDTTSMASPPQLTDAVIRAPSCKAI
jgi:hypothetical protein